MHFQSTKKNASSWLSKEGGEEKFPTPFFVNPIVALSLDETVWHLIKTTEAEKPHHLVEKTEHASRKSAFPQILNSHTLMS